MIGKVALGSICAGIALLIAVRSQHQSVQVGASALGAGLLSYTTTTCVLDNQRRQKRRMADAEAYLEFLRQINYERSGPVMPTACRGCRHYHGQKYGGNLLVCGMHPYGVAEDHCPDWQETIQHDPGSVD
jgi:hypothetical protein